MTERLLPSVLSSFAKARFPGNAITEYAVIGVTIVGVSLAMLEMIGNTLNGSLSDLHRDMSHHETLVREEMAEMNAAEAARLGKLEGSLTAAEARLLQQSVAEKIQTAGANGSTQVLAKQLRLLAEKLLKEGKISQEQYGMLMNLSNQGYRIARLEAVVEDGIQHAKGDVNLFVETKYNLDGEEQTAQTLSRMVGFSGVSPRALAAEGFLEDTGMAGMELNLFLKYYRDIRDAGILQDPVVKSTVESAVLQIAQVGEVVENTIYVGVENGNLPPDTTALNSKMASTVTKMSSDRICEAGDFKTDGVECTAN